VLIPSIALIVPSPTSTSSPYATDPVFMGIFLDTNRQKLSGNHRKSRVADF
jgi:hypothetical protein